MLELKTTSQYLGFVQKIYYYNHKQHEKTVLNLHSTAIS